MYGSSRLWEESYEIAKISGGFEQISNFLLLKLSYVASTGLPTCKRISSPPISSAFAPYPLFSVVFAK
jgi:hypothetical protein